MKTVYCILLCCSCLVSCHSQAKNKEMKSDLRISLLFYPSMSKEAPIYSVDIANDSLIIKRYSIGVETAERIKLTDEQCLEVNKHTSALSQKYDRSNNWAKGAWGCTLKVDNQVYYEDNLFSFYSPPEEIKLLIDYIVNLSPISIDLYWF